MKSYGIGIVMLATMLSVKGSTLCARKNKSCAYQLWTNESEPAEACQMTYYKRNSRECGALEFEDTIDMQNQMGDVQLYAYVTEEYSQTLFRVSFTNIKWKRALMRFSRMGLPDERNTCRKFNIWLNMTVPNSSALIYDCPWSESEYEGQDYSLEYEFFALPIAAYTRFIFRVPFFENIRSSTDVKFLQIFTYLDVTDSDFLYLHIQVAPQRYNITSYLVEVIRERSNISTRLTVQIVSAKEALNGEIVFPYPTWNEFGYFYFNVSPLSDICEENMCVKASTPKIFMGRKKSSLVIGIVGASVIVFALFYAMFFWNRQKGTTKEPTSSRVLLVYKSSVNSHCNVVRNLARLLNDVLQIEVLLDVFEVPETIHQDPILWCNQAFNDATHVVYIASPDAPPSKTNANNIYRIDGVAMKYINKELVRNYSSKQILVVTFPYSINAIPPELTNVRRFDLMKDMDSFVNSLIMLPYQSWTIFHIYRPNRFRGEPQYMELMVSILGAQREVEILSNCAASPNNATPKITVTENSTENVAAAEDTTEDEEALLKNANNFSIRVADLDLSGNASNDRPAVTPNTEFSINIQDVAQ